MVKVFNAVKTAAMKDNFIAAVLTLLLVLCVIPSFANLGKLSIQIASPVLLSVIIASLSLKIKNGIKLMSLSLNAFLFLMIFAAVVYQINLQLKNLIYGKFSGFINMFYYDKPLSVGLVWLSVMFTYTVIRIFHDKGNKKKYALEYDRFFNMSGRGFLVYYAILLFYCFVIIRGADSQGISANFVPFKMIADYYRSIENKGYEIFMIFFGNLLFFTPMGFYMRVIKPTVKLIFLLPVPIVISSAIEISQLVLKNGHCDIDDVILNTAGFYFGVFLELFIDYIVKRHTKGLERTVFNWRPFSSFYRKVQ